MVTNETFIHSYYRENYLFSGVHEHIGKMERTQQKPSIGYFRIILIKEGEGIITIHKDSYPLISGDIILISNKENYILESKEGMDVFTLEFEISFVTSIEYYSFDLKYLKVFIDRSEEFEHVIDRQNNATENIRNLLYAIEKELKERKRNHKLMVKVHLLSVLVNLSRNYDYINRSPKAMPFSREKTIGICKVIDYIHENLSKPIKLSDLTCISNMSSSVFITAFKEINGLTPMEYIKHKRIAYSIQLLKSTDKTVLEIATSCGYNSTSNFNKAFKEVVGKTPKDIRKSF